MNSGEAALSAGWTVERARARSALLGALLLFSAALPLSIAVAQIALTAAFLAWFLAGRPVPAQAGALGPPVLAYAALTLASALASTRPRDSLADTKELLLFSVLLLVPAAAAGALPPARRMLGALLIGSGVSALWGVALYLASPGGLEHRSSGPLGHYMTFGGVMMLAAVAAITVLLAPPSRLRPLAALVLLPLLAGVAVSWARNAWLGMPAGIAVAAAGLRPRLVPWLLVFGMVAFLLAPSEMRERFASSFDPGANADRVEMLRFGTSLVAAHPLLGVGPNRIPDAWREQHPGERVQPHLHDNFIQIAAERGVPALLAWLWLLAALAQGAWRRARRQPGAALPVLGLAVIAALLVAGVFEYNFGDSEVKMAFLLLAALAVHETEPGHEASR